MTPKEKAEELFHKFRQFSLLETGLSGMRIYKAERLCALIAVEEILKIEGSNLHQDYWQQVKQQIEKL